MTFDRTTLLAYHAGTCPQDVALAIEAQLATDDTLAERLMALDPAAEMVAAAFAATQPPRAPTLQAPAPYWRPAALAASAALAAVAVWNVMPSQVSDWHQQVAEYQVLYTPQTIAMIEPSYSELADQFIVLRTALAIGFDADAMSNIEGLDLLRAQLLGFEGAPLGQIVFADAQGRPIALCLMQGAGEPTQEVAELAGLNTVSWGTSTHQFILVGNVPDADLQTWAAAMQGAV